jgi:uncharacterized membrane protein YdbT with pleckstrin-like domain
MSDQHITDVDNKFLELIELDPKEKLVCAIKKHPIGLFLTYALGIGIAIVTLFIGVFAGDWLEAQNNFESSLPVGIVVSILAIALTFFILIATYIAGFIYQNNIIIVTTDKVAQILYKNLVDRKISQLSLGDLQDVTVEQRGLLARIFKFGTLIIETAGEQDNYNFSYAPFPYDCAKEIVTAREASIEAFGN